MHGHGGCASAAHAGISALRNALLAGKALIAAAAAGEWAAALIVLLLCLLALAAGERGADQTFRHMHRPETWVHEKPVTTGL